ncbi:MAG: sigma-54-dependent Fis family transcriptional regulator [Polyangiaceae bacterium]|nr:sigma-54-dependent Fis family transcriptional regulator [Polyangiaceae bacterium]
MESVHAMKPVEVADSTSQKDPIPQGDGDRTLLIKALESGAGSCLVLDTELRVVGATGSAEQILGTRVRPGTRAVKLLCGEMVNSPLAEALAKGRPVTTTIVPVMGKPDGQFIRVRAKPLRAGFGTAGWLLLLTEEPRLDGDEPEELLGIWTRDVQMKRLFRLAEKVAKCDAPVLIRGEPGTGKESLAAAIHELSLRKAGLFSVIDAGMVTPVWLEDQLAKHAQSADGGTLFIDNLERLPFETQGALLRALEMGVITPLGHRGSSAQAASIPNSGEFRERHLTVNTRIISATSASLQYEVESGQFRADLLYRLRIVSLYLPPLRARRGDVLFVAEKIILQLNSRGGRVIEKMSDAAILKLTQHDWPGNVRELRAAIETAFATGDGPVLLPSELPADLTDPFATGEAVVGPASEPPSERMMDEASRIKRAIERANGDRAQAAITLGMSRTTLWRRMRALGLLGPGSDA